MSRSPHEMGSTSSSLIVRVKSKDAKAWERLVFLYGPTVNKWISRKVPNDEDANDVFQEVFYSVARGIERFRKDRPTDTFRGWLRTVVNSKVADHFVRRGRQPTGKGGSAANRRLQQIPESFEEDDADDVQELRMRALEMIQNEFEERTWQIFWRVTVVGESPQEVAADMGVTPTAVRVAKSRVLKRLREELSDD